jgi:hypothetical protein
MTISAPVNFGCGYLYLKDAAGRSVRVAEAEGITLDIDQSVIEIKGANRFPLGFGFGESKVSGKITSLVFDTTALTMLAEATESAGSIAIARETITVPSHELEYADELVEIKRILDAAGDEMTLIEGAVSAVGYYAEADGTITTNESEPAGPIAEYEYEDDTGTTYTVANGAQGLATTYELLAWNETDGQKHGVRLPNVVIPKLSTSMMIAKSSAVDMDYQAGADDDGNVFKLYLSR